MIRVSFNIGSNHTHCSIHNNAPYNENPKNPSTQRATGTHDSSPVTNLRDRRYALQTRTWYPFREQWNGEALKTSHFRPSMVHRAASAGATAAWPKTSTDCCWNSHRDLDDCCFLRCLVRCLRRSRSGSRGSFLWS